VNAVELQFRGRCEFLPSLRLELFDALQTVLNPGSRIHPAWKETAISRLTPRFDVLCKRLGRSSEIWPVIPAVLPKHQATFTFSEILSGIENQPIEQFQRAILLGVIHSEEVVSLALWRS